MKTDKELGEIGAAAASQAQTYIDGSNVVDLKIPKDEPTRTAFAAAVRKVMREEIFAGVEGMPSVDKLAEAFIDAHNSSDPAYGDVQAGVRAVRNLMLAAFAKQMEEKDAELEIFKRIRDAKIELQAKYDDLQVTMDSVTMNANWSVELMNKAEYKLAAAEARLAEIAKLPERWRLSPSPRTYKWCADDLEHTLKFTPTAEEIERAEFDPPSKPIAIASVLLSRNDGTRLVTSHTLHWVEGIDDEDKMRGIAVEGALKLKPGFSVSDIAIDVIPARAAKEVKATPAPPQFPV